jgi:hypothetical protein
LLVGKDKEVIKSRAEVIYGTVWTPTV